MLIEGGAPGDGDEEPIDPRTHALVMAMLATVKALPREEYQSALCGLLAGVCSHMHKNGMTRDSMIEVFARCLETFWGEE